MTTRLTFEAPADLSVGRVTVTNEAGVVGEWVATPNQKTLDLSEAAPGLYTAEIAPVGQRPRAYVFEVKADEANTITAPLFSALVAGGAQVAFGDVSDMQAAVETLHRGAVEPPAPAAKRQAVAPPTVWTAQSTHTASVSRVLSVGLSQDESESEIGGWQPYTLNEPSVELEDGGLNILIAPPDDALRRHPRLRLSAALEGVRVERLMVPVFRGGVRIAFRASPLAGADVTVAVTALDPERRALLQALQVGVAEEARAVFEDVLSGGSITRFIEGAEEDPWAAMAATLLTVRFPELFGEKSPDWGPRLVKLYPWATDAHIVLARHHLFAAGGEGDQAKAADLALASLAMAHRIGAPYFSYSNQLMGEMLGGLASFASLGEGLLARAADQLASWRSDVPLQRTAGAIFSWQRSNLKSRAAGVVEPYRSPGGNLSERYARILFRGQVDAARISLGSATVAPLPPKAGSTEQPATEGGERIDGSGAVLASSLEATAPRAAEPPGLSLPVTAPDDPNKGRFGGLATRDGHTLSASFAETSEGEWVDIRLTVTAERSLAPSYSDVVEFFLHPTFSPSRLKAGFRGHEAGLSVRAWGGFTVGAWLPERGIELECDLAELEGVPALIRER